VRSCSDRAPAAETKEGGGLRLHLHPHQVPEIRAVDAQELDRDPRLEQVSALVGVGLVGGVVLHDDDGLH